MFIKKMSDLKREGQEISNNYQAKISYGLCQIYRYPIRLEVLEKQTITRQYGTSLENSFVFSTTTTNETLVASTAAQSAIAAFPEIPVTALIHAMDDTEKVTDDDSHEKKVHYSLIKN